MSKEVDIPCNARFLHCKIVEPVSRSSARLLIVHGYGEHAGRYARFMRFLAAAGIASEAVDLRGHGRSPGRRGFVLRWEDYLEDLHAFLEREGRADASAALPTFMLGHSHGGLIAAAACERGMLAPYRFSGCILSSPYFATRQQVPFYKRMLARVVDRFIPWLPVSSGLRVEWLTGEPAMREETRRDPLMNRIATPRWFLSVRTAQAQTMRDAAEFKLPLLCLVGDNDIIADPRYVAEFCDKAGSPDKSLYTYAGGVHELLRDVSSDKASADVLGWVRARMIVGSEQR